MNKKDKCFVCSKSTELMYSADRVYCSDCGKVKLDYGLRKSEPELFKILKAFENRHLSLDKKARIKLAVYIRKKSMAANPNGLGLVLKTKEGVMPRTGSIPVAVV